MHLESARAQTVEIPRAGCGVSFLEGETIWTESSHKYRAEEVLEMGRRSGFGLLKQWIDRGMGLRGDFVYRGVSYRGVSPIREASRARSCGRPPRPN